MPDPAKGLSPGEQRLWDAVYFAVVRARLQLERHLYSTPESLALQATAHADAAVEQRRKRGGQ